MNILVVEDEKNLNDAMCHVLTEDGCHAKAAYDGKAGYELAKTGEYDVVVLDVMLPEMDGFEVVHQLRRDGHLSQKEFEVMRMLMSSTGRVVSKHDLLASIWGTEGDTSENSAEAYISFLRKKLSHLHSEVQITTLRMLGYRLEELG